MIALLALTALAVPPDFKVTKEDVSGCDLMLGPADADGVVPMRAECTWPEVTLENFDRHFAQWGDHDVFFGTISVSDVASEADGTTVVNQTHVTKGIKDRRIVLDGKRTAIEGGFRYEWTKSAQAPEVAKREVEAARSDGYWEVRTAEGGGVAVVHQLSYDPGGSVPGFVVRWFQTSGLQSVVEDLHAYLTTH